MASAKPMVSEKRHSELQAPQLALFVSRSKPAKSIGSPIIQVNGLALRVAVTQECRNVQIVGVDHMRLEFGR